MKWYQNLAREEPSKINSSELGRLQNGTSCGDSRRRTFRSADDHYRRSVQRASTQNITIERYTVNEVAVKWTKLGLTTIERREGAWIVIFKFKASLHVVSMPEKLRDKCVKAHVLVWSTEVHRKTAWKNYLEVENLGADDLNWLRKH